MAKKRAVNDFVIWSLSVVLAAIFLLTGVPKLIGLGTVGLQASAMRGFPDWIRVIVGIVETLGAIGLLIPATATFAALALAVIMVPATLTQFMSGEGAMWVPPLLLAALVFVAWFLLVDSIANRPFFTPETLGHAMLTVLGKQPTEDDSRLVHVLAYTVFHFAAFMIVGLAAALIVFLAQKEPSILFGFIVLFVAIEVGFYALVGLLEQTSPLRGFAWYTVLIGNLLAAAA